MSRGIWVKCLWGFRVGVNLFTCRNVLGHWSCLRHSSVQAEMRCWRDWDFSWEREMGGLSITISVAAFAKVSTRSLPITASISQCFMTKHCKKIEERDTLLFTILFNKKDKYHTASLLSFLVSKHDLRSFLMLGIYKI